METSLLLTTAASHLAVSTPRLNLIHRRRHHPDGKAPVFFRPTTVAAAAEGVVGVASSFVKLDKAGRLCSPRAAREHALLILYAACLEGSDPVRLFDKRVNARYPPMGFDKESLLMYDHMRFGGPPVIVESEEEANELILGDEKESANEEDVLSAPPKLVYGRFTLRNLCSLTRQMLEAVVQRWDQHILAINKITPSNWKDEPAGKIMEHCILHLAMAEMTVLGIRHQIVINEAVDLAKRFCDGSAQRIINGCLRTFLKDHRAVDFAQTLNAQS